MVIGIAFRRRATRHLDAYYLTERKVSWWMVGLSGCSSYTDIGGTMLIIGLMFYLGVKSVWVLHIAWGFFMMALFLLASSCILTVGIAMITPPADMDSLVRFCVRVRPFGFWEPVRLEAVRRRLVPGRDPMPLFDVLNALVAASFQLALGFAPFYMFLKDWANAGLWLGISLAAAGVLYYTWYRRLPSKDEI